MSDINWDLAPEGALEVVQYGKPSPYSKKSWWFATNRGFSTTNDIDVTDGRVVALGFNEWRGYETRS